MSAIGHVSGGADTVVDALLAAIGKRGTLMLPTFTHGSTKVFNPMASPSTNGAIPNALWRRADAQRTEEPTHAVAAIGPKAATYCAGHPQNGAFGLDGPIGRLMHGGGYVLMLGVNYETCTMYHVGEMTMPCGCIDMFGNDYRIVDREGNVVRTRGLAYRSEQCPVPQESINEAIARAGLERRGMVGKAPARLTKAVNVFNMRKRLLKNFCPNCRIKPRYLERV
jgi:aminoglycoside 3-N-acetyltransferase